jgi:tetratricopeptide (TPR) repeat protein
MNERLKRFSELYDQGINLLQSGQDEAAMRCLYDAAREAPEGWLMLAAQLIRDGQHNLAMDRLNEVIKLSSKRPKVQAAALNHIGMIYSHSGRKDEALEAFTRASQLAPEFPDTFSNIGLSHQWRHDYETALRFVDKALKIDPWHEQAQFIRSMVLLLNCDYERGWREYECRWRSNSNGLAKIATPVREWDGTNGKEVFIYGEQGHGDLLLMLRYARELRARGMVQRWVAHKGMDPLLRTVPEIDQVVVMGDPLPEFDCHIPAASLPRILGTTIETIPSAPYLPKPPSERIAGGPHIGICWRGSKTAANDLIRSTALAEWQPILDVPGITIHSLQVDGADEALLYPQVQPFQRPENWLETARRVAAMDLVISVDTSIVHLAGAMGVPCWVVMHCRPYFVYPYKFGNSCPWYPSVKLFRQQKEFEWQPVMRRIAEALAGVSFPTRC